MGLKVLHINTFDKYGGAEEFALSISSTRNETLLVKEKNTREGNVLEFKKNIFDWIFIFLNKVFWRIGIKKTFKQAFSLSEQFNFSYSKLKKLNCYKEADIIHLHNLHGGYFDIKALSKIVKEKKIVWTVHDMWPLTGGEAYVFDSENYKVGIGYTPYNHHYPLNNPFFDKRGFYIKLKKKIYSRLGKNIAFVAPSKHTFQNVKDSHVIDVLNGVSQIYYGIDCNIFVNKAQRKWKKPRVLFYNTSSPFKNSKLIAGNLNKIDLDIELFVIGDPIKTNEGLQFEVENLGYVSSKKQMADIFNKVDIFIFSSNIETFGMFPCEAASCGICVLGSNIPTIKEQFDVYGGVLFENNFESLYGKLAFYTENLDAAREIGEKASKIIQREFNRKLAIAQYGKLYKNMIN